LYTVKIKGTNKVVAYCTEWKDAKAFFHSQKLDGVEYVIETTMNEDTVQIVDKFEE
tara:strand:- start:10398 stop:10565 length:168 start_codon:yes stop_codon:yes gene_type:complete